MVNHFREKCVNSKHFQMIEPIWNHHVTYHLLSLLLYQKYSQKPDLLHPGVDIKILLINCRSRTKPGQKVQKFLESSVQLVFSLHLTICRVELLKKNKFHHILIVGPFCFPNKIKRWKKNTYVLKLLKNTYLGRARACIYYIWVWWDMALEFLKNY